LIQEQTEKATGNVGVLERLACAVAGGFLVTRGLTKRSPASLLGAAAGADLLYRGITGHCAIYGVLGLNTAVNHKSGAEVADTAPEVKRAITIGKSPEELYQLWRDPQKLAQIVAPFADVIPIHNGWLHWRMRGPLKKVFEWDSRFEGHPNESLSWETLPGGTLVNRGTVTFRPGPNSTGTEVTLCLQFEPPLGPVGAGIANWLAKVPRAVAGQTLRRFKSLAETGEIPSLGSNPSGRGSADLI
jgi:uncharacterized membrane protein